MLSDTYRSADRLERPIRLSCPAVQADIGRVVCANPIGMGDVKQTVAHGIEPGAAVRELPAAQARLGIAEARVGQGQDRALTAGRITLQGNEQRRIRDDDRIQSIVGLLCLN